MIAVAQFSAVETPSSASIMYLELSTILFEIALF